MSGPYRDQSWVRRGSQVKSDLSESPVRKLPKRTISPIKETITILDSDDEDEAHISTWSKRLPKRPRVESDPKPSPKPDDKAEALRRAQEEVQEFRDTQEILKKEANDRQEELEKIIKELQEENARKNVLIMTSPKKEDIEDANNEKVRLQQELSRTQSALTNAVSEKVESQQKSKMLEKELGEIRLKNSGLQREIKSANEKTNEKITKLEEHIAKLEEHTKSCIVSQQPPEFFKRGREVCQRIMDNYAKLAAERGWEKKQC